MSEASTHVRAPEMRPKQPKSTGGKRRGEEREREREKQTRNSVSGRGRGKADKARYEQLWIGKKRSLFVRGSSTFF